MQPKSNAGTIAAILGGVAAVGSIAAVALASSSSKKPQGRFGNARARPAPKKPCGCGR